MLECCKLRQKCFHETFAKCLIVTILMKICEQQLLSWQMRDVKMFWILWFSSLPTEKFIFGTVTGPIYFPATRQLTWYSIKIQGSQRSEKTWKIVLFQKSQEKPQKAKGKKTKSWQSQGKVREFCQSLVFFFICLNWTYTYPFLYQYLLISLNISTFSFMPCLVASLSFEGTSVNIFNW